MDDRPNILFFVTDQQRYDWVGMNPRVPVRTPNIERLADRGVHFREAVCPSPLCGPSRACLASGMEYDDCGVLDHSRNYPHDPWDVTHDMHGWYRGENAVDFPGPAPVGETDGYTGENHNEIRRNYAAMVENIDRHLGRYREELRKRGEWENTIVAFTSDHGEMLGDQGRWKKQLPYHPSVSVPLVIGGPGIRDGHVSDEPASVLDLHATALDYAGLDHDGVDSRSLRPYLASETEDHREYVYSGLGSWRMAYDGRYKLITGFDPDAGHGLDAEMNAGADPLLFDRRRDVFETTDVARKTPEVVERLRDRIETHRTVDGMDNQYTS